MHDRGIFVPPPFLNHDDPLPPAHLALRDPDGLLALTLDMDIPRLEEAYAKGIFPWPASPDYVCWWSPDPRMVLETDNMRISRSLGKRLRQIERAQAAGDLQSCVVRVDRNFEAVIRACAQTGTPGREDTWITNGLLQTYLAWHRLGRAHSIETWMDGELVGGLYGVSMGRMFFGESMFSQRTDASKIALAHLVRFLSAHGVPLVDCQVYNPHLASLGAHEIDRKAFLAHLETVVHEPALPWRTGWLDAQGELHEEDPLSGT